ncbi:MAG: hypothetical protein H8D23_11000 [Candidatus Brocadiales bacterium]|nr:hypothetical protein [Candidatus Brocadiales bacterium]
MGSDTTSLDIFPEEIFFVHDIKAKDKEVRVDKEAAYDGFFIKSDSVCGAMMKIYSMDSKLYKAQVELLELTITSENSKGHLPLTVELDSASSDEERRKLLAEYQAEPWEKTKERMIEEVNKVSRESTEDRLSMKELYMKADEEGAVKGFTVKHVSKFVADIGNGEDVIDVVNDAHNHTRPWEIIDRLKKSRVNQ